MALYLKGGLDVVGDVISFNTYYNNQTMQITNENRVHQPERRSFEFLFNKNVSPVEKAECIRCSFDLVAPGTPFPVVKFANSLGIDVFVEDLSTLDENQSTKGYLAIKPNEPAVIVVSESESYGHQRWTVAHELWHYFEHKNAERYDSDYYAERGNYDDNSSSDEEQKANQFATALLMPAQEFKEVYNQVCEQGEVATRCHLEKHFAVSPTAIRRRMCELNLRVKNQ